jgi:FKBP-type peptidyl-prolyl cis-trans isomerase
MHHRHLLFIASLSLLSACATTDNQNTAALRLQELNSTDAKQKQAYAAGYQQMKTLLSSNSPYDRDGFALGLQDALLEQAPKLDKTELEQALDGPQLGQLNLELVKQTLLKQGRSFLARNKTEPEVKTLASGLQYKVTATGQGQQTAKPEDTVQILYRFSRLGGSDLSKDALPGKSLRKTPVARLPKGLQEAITQMTPGAQWRLYLPPDLLHGENGSLSSGILPNETVLCDLELESIEAGKL